MFEWHKKEKALFTGSRFGFGGGGGGGSGVSVSYDATGGTKIASGDYNLHFSLLLDLVPLVVLFLILVIQVMNSKYLLLQAVAAAVLITQVAVVPVA